MSPGDLLFTPNNQTMAKRSHFLYLDKCVMLTKTLSSSSFHANGFLWHGLIISHLVMIITFPV